MDGMMLHCGAAEATFAELKAVQLPEHHPKFRDKMETYSTVPHGILVGTIRSLLRETIHPDVVVEEQFGLSTGNAYPGAKMFGLMKLDLIPKEISTVVDAGVEAAVATVNGLDAIEAADQSDQQGYEIVNVPDDHDLMAGPWDPDEAPVNNVDDPIVQVLDTIEVDSITPSMVFRNSYDRSMSISGGLGYNCFVCDNLALSGEIMFARKHTRKAMGDIMHIFMSMIMTMAEQYQFDQEFREAAKQFEMSQDQGFELLGRMAGNSLLPFVGGEESEFATSIKEWRNPTHEVFQDRTLWSLFNAVTAAQRRSKIGHRLETGSMASKVFREVLGEIWVTKAAEISAKYADSARVR
jgi:hypothetical protein